MCLYDLEKAFDSVEFSVLLKGLFHASLMHQSKELVPVLEVGP